MRAGLERAGERQEARTGEQIAAYLIEREDDEIGARQMQQRQRAVDESPGELCADQQRDCDQAERRGPERGGVERVEGAAHAQPLPRACLPSPLAGEGGSGRRPEPGEGFPSFSVKRATISSSTDVGRMRTSLFQ